MTTIPTRQRRRRTRTLGSLNAFATCYTLALFSSGSNSNNNNNNGNGVILKVVSAARMMAPKPIFLVDDDLPAGGDGDGNEEGLDVAIDRALIPSTHSNARRRRRSLLSQNHRHGHEFSVKDHVGDTNRWKGGGAAEHTRIAKRDARENPNGHVAHKESANPGHSSPQVTEKKTNPKLHKQNAKKRLVHLRKEHEEEADDDDDDDDGPGGCCGE